MKFKFGACFIFLLSFSAWAFNKDFKTVGDKLPHEFTLLFESLKVEAKTPQDQIRMVGLCQDLDQNLGFLEKEHVFLLVKSEVIKNVLEHKFGRSRQTEINTLLLERLEGEFIKKKNYLSPFAQWIWRSILAELNYRKSLGLITSKSFNPRAFEGAKHTEALKFQRFLKYLLPWIDQMENLSVSQFNQQVKETSWDVLTRLNYRSLLFKRFASMTQGSVKSNLFNIPQKLLDLHPEDIRMKNNSPVEEELKDKAIKEKIEASKTMEKVTPDDMSPISEEIIDELDKIQ